MASEQFDYTQDKDHHMHSQTHKHTNTHRIPGAQKKFKPHFLTTVSSIPDWLITAEKQSQLSEWNQFKQK